MRREAKRKAIITAARHVFLKEGFQCSSMEMISVKAGVSKATLYSHFEGKEELFMAVSLDVIENCQVNIGAIKLDPAFCLRAEGLIARLHSVCSLDEETISIMRSALASGSPEISKLIFIKFKENFFQKILAALKSEERIEASLGGNARDLAEFVFYVLIGLQYFPALFDCSVNRGDVAWNANEA